MVRDLIAPKAPIQVFETEHGGSPLAWALHGSLNSWERDKGEYPSVAKALLTAGARYQSQTVRSKVQKRSSQFSNGIPLNVKSAHQAKKKMGRRSGPSF